MFRFSCAVTVFAVAITLAPAAQAQRVSSLTAGHGVTGTNPTTAQVPQHSAARIWNDELLNAIRIDTPRPTVHARNLFHLSVGMWDAWAAYDPRAVGYVVQESATHADVEAARAEAISYASYRLLKHRFQTGPGTDASQAAFDAKMADLGYDAEVSSTEGPSPAALGNRIAAAVIAHGFTDGANEINDYDDDTGYFPINEPLVFDLPGTVMNDPNRWQPLAFDFLVLQNGIVIGTATQEFLGPNWGQVTPFALEPEEMSVPYVYLDPGPPPMLGGVGNAQFKANAVANIRYSSWVDPTDGVTMDISPAVFHNNPLGTQDGTGYPVNPVTGQPYAPNVVKRADYVRVLAEFWADGPESETPPGHWNTLANYVADHPLVEKRIGGEGPVVDDLEWDVKVYLALNGAVHDAAVAAWGAKGYYDYSRPISHIRHMAGRGQDSDLLNFSYHPDGLPLVPGLIEVIDLQSSAPGQRHAHLAPYLGDIAIRSWVGAPEDSETQFGGVGWIRAVEWLPYQRETFVTPPFAGYLSGHSTFSRAAAEVLAGITGSEFFPGGLGTFVAPQNDFLEFEAGPTETLVLQWATYYDAADEAGISRLYGGIHPAADDFPGRVLGSHIGTKAYIKALEYFGPAGPGETYASCTIDQFVAGIGTMHQQDAHPLSGNGGTPFTFLPTHAGLDALDVQTNGDALFSVTASGGVDHAGGFSNLDRDRLYRFVAATGAIEPVALGFDFDLGNLSAVDRLADGSIVFSTDALRGVGHPGGYTVVRPQNAYKYDANSGSIDLFFDGRALGLVDLDAIELLADGRIVFSTATSTFVDGQILRHPNAYAVEPDGTLSLQVDGEGLGLLSLDAVSLEDGFEADAARVEAGSTTTRPIETDHRHTFGSTVEADAGDSRGAHTRPSVSGKRGR